MNDPQWMYGVGQVSGFHAYQFKTIVQTILHDGTGNGVISTNTVTHNNSW